VIRDASAVRAIFYPQSSILAPASSRIRKFIIIRGQGVTKNQEAVGAIMNSIAAAQ
jgi:hypothetical protein